FAADYRQQAVAIERMVEVVRPEPAERLVEYAPVYVTRRPPRPPFPAKTPADRLQTLEVSGLSYTYPGNGRGLRAISLRLKRGDFVVITGRIGSGKSTLARVLLGLLPKDAGEIRWNGQVVENPAEFFVPPRAAYTAQVPRLFSDTLRENILLGVPEESVDLPAVLRAA